jgi:ribosomal-protein-alanine N-acetyltransferase
MPFAIRPMQRGDIRQVVDIEWECFPTSVPTNFQQELANRLARYVVAVDLQRTLPTAPWTPPPPPSGSGVQRVFLPLKRLLGQPSDRQEPPTPDYLAGFLGLWYMVDEAHIVSVGVRESYRGQGIGELLIIASIEMALERLSRVVTLEVRRSNNVAQALYEKYSFAKVGVRKGYYHDNREDAIIMTTEEIHSPAYQEKFRRLVEQHQQRWGVSRRQLG